MAANKDFEDLFSICVATLKTSSGVGNGVRVVKNSGVDNPSNSTTLEFKSILPCLSLLDTTDSKDAVFRGWQLFHIRSAGSTGIGVAVIIAPSTTARPSSKDRLLKSNGDGPMDRVCLVGHRADEHHLVTRALSTPRRDLSLMFPSWLRQQDEKDAVADDLVLTCAAESRCSSMFRGMAM